MNRRRAAENEYNYGDIIPDNASYDNLDEYLELMYQVSGNSEREREECLNAQIRGTSMLLKLCRNVGNLENLIQNNTVMSVLTRVLKDESKKSMELTFNILRIFLAFSNFVEMHALLSEYRIGIHTIKAIEYETKRSELLASEKKEKDGNYDRDLRNAKDALKKNNAAIANGEVTSHTEEGLKAKCDKIRHRKERDTERSKVLTKKQDKLLFVGFYILLNLAEDASVERKMVKKGLLEYLEGMLNRTSPDLVILCVTFLKKIGIYEENKNIMKASDIVSKIAKFIPCSSQALVMISLRFLFDLSFDQECREQIVKCALIPKLVGLLKTPSCRARTLKLLYHLSMDDRCKSMFTYTDSIPLIVGMIINFPQNMLAKELAALAVNLSFNAKNVELMISNRGLNRMMDRVVTHKDPLLLKIIRNISLWSFNIQQDLTNMDQDYKYVGLWSPHIKTLLQMTTSCDNHDILVELLGILANLTQLDLPTTQTWPKLLRDFGLISLFSKILVPGMAQNDVILEVILLLSAIAMDAEACAFISSTNLIQLLHRLWQDKGKDDRELLLQLIHLFHILLLQESSREEALYGTRVVVDIMDCLYHRNSVIRNAADSALDLVLELDRKVSAVGGDASSISSQIRKKRFESFNLLWLKETTTVDDETEHEYGAGIGNHKEMYHGGQDQNMDEEDMNWQMMMANRHSMKATDSGDESSIIGPAAKVGRGSFDGQYVDEGEGMGMFCDDSNRVNMHRENDYTEGNAGGGYDEQKNNGDYQGYAHDGSEHIGRMHSQDDNFGPCDFVF